MIARVLTIVGGLALAADATAATRLTVLVRSQATQAPLDGAVVCVGTAVNRSAQGRRSTANGAAVFDSIPDGDWLITTWKSNFATAQSSLLVNRMTGTSVSRTVVLSAGGGADPCPTSEVRVAGTTISAADTPSITTFSINGGLETMDWNDAVYLAVQFSGAATAYRVSEISDQFPEATAAWRPFVRYPAFGGSVRLPGGTTFSSLAATKRVYLQLRNGTRTSNIANDSVTVLQNYSASASQAVAIARQNGFTFTGLGRACIMDPARDNVEVMRLMIEPTRDPNMPVSAYVCTIGLFSGRTLAPHWRVTGYTWAAVSTRMTDCSVVPTSGVPAIAVLRKSLCAIDWKSVQLSGPYGGRWQDAFAR